MSNILQQGTAIVNLAELRRLEDRDIDFRKIEKTYKDRISELESTRRSHSILVFEECNHRGDYYKHILRTDDDAIGSVIEDRDDKISSLNKLFFAEECKVEKLRKEIIRSKNRGFWDRVFNR